MKFRVEKDALHDAIALVARVAGKPPHGLATLAVEGDKLTVSASDGDVSITTTLAVSDGEAGEVMVPAKPLASGVGALRDGAVHAEVETAELTLRVGASSYSSPIATEMWRRPTPEVGPGAPLAGGDLLAMLARVVPAASRDDTRGIIQGVLFEPGPDGLRLVATDSYRLHVGLTACEWDGEPCVVPAAALRELVRLHPDGTLLVGRSATAIAFGMGETVLTAQLYDGQYPNVMRLIPAETPHHLVVRRDDLAEAAKRVAAAGDGLLVWDIEGSTVLLSARAKDGPAAQDSVEVEWDGPALRLGTASDHLADLLSNARGEDVSFGITDALKPVTVRGDDEWTGLICPRRVS